MNGIDVMQCEQTRQRWHIMMDDATRDEAVEAHIAACDSCQAYVAEMRLVTDALGGLRNETDLIAAGSPIVQTGRDGDAPLRHPVLIWLGRVAALAACFALAVTASLYLRADDVPDPGVVAGFTSDGVEEGAEPSPVKVNIVHVYLRGETARDFHVVKEEGVESEPVEIISFYPKRVIETVPVDGESDNAPSMG